MILKRKTTHAPVAVGDKVLDFRGETATVTGWEEPKHSASTGRVYVTVGEGSQGFYPSVYGLYWGEDGGDSESGLTADYDDKGAPF